ncbi:fructokinase [Amycolatopsis arida]|uniref:Fructokinase n=1 Tax=Amycolatopsis arida TaxID=587909 RepID=A0A1I5QHQ1_9PSEU|nr:carbohydrate kinase [Amycolatopsis arida]TDX98843.1 fructokinase [Amycolatopsis arida]SFP45627.1 fructokinase [Amycolatopsis arida]
MIVVGGEALVDLVPDAFAEMSTVENGLRPLWPRLGGGPYNTALAAGRLGAPVAFLSRLSTDRFGDALLRRLHSSTVDTSLVQRGPEPTTLAVVALDDHGTARYTFYTEGTADRLVADPGPLPAEVSALSLGTLGMVLEPGASTYEVLLRRAAAAGTLTVLDPNIRADLIADPPAYRARFASWLPDVGLLKLSVDDAAWLADGVDPEAAARSWVDDAGVRAVVLTWGAGGLSVLTATGVSVRVPVVPARVVDTIGAGDTVHGALLAWLHGHRVADPASLGEREWRAALRFAARAAAITVSRRGAEPPAAAELDLAQC